MKRNFKNIIQYAFFATVFLSFISCSSRDNTEVVPEEGTSLMVSVTGINDYIEIDAQASASKDISTSVKGNLVKEHITNFGDFDALVSFGKDVSKSENSKYNSIASASVIKPMAVTPIATNIKYRIVIYDAADNNNTTPVANVVLTSGSATGTPIKIDAGKNYNWYAFSTNETSVPNINNGVVDKAGLMNKDVLWASGNLSAQFGNNNLSITFSRNTSRINVNLDSLGMSGIITSSSIPQIDLFTGSNSVLKYGDLNIFDGSFSNLTTFTASTRFSGSSGINGSIRTYTLYTVDNTTSIPVGSLIFKIGNFTVVKADNSSNSSSINYSSSTGSLNNTSAYTFSKASSYTASIKLIESAITVGGVKWARENLKSYNPQFGNNAYLLANNMANLATNPSLISNFYYSSISKDYCANLYPAGIWRLPTKAEFDAIIPINQSVLFAPNTAVDPNTPNGYLALQFTDPATVINTGYPLNSQKLNLPVAGYGNTATSGYDISLAAPTKSKMETGYWTKDGTTYGKQYFYTDDTFTYDGTNKPSIYWGGNVAPVANEWISIRCVRQ